MADGAPASADEALSRLDRRLHLCVGRDLFLPTRLRVHAGAAVGESSEWIFGEAEMHETLGLLQQHVPARLAALLSQRVATRDTLDARGDTLKTALTFQPSSASTLWLLGSAEADGRARSAVPYTLLCDVEPI